MTLLLDQIWKIPDYITPFQAALITSLLLFYLVYLFLRDNDLPPGPIGFPYIGYFPFIHSERGHLQLTKMVEKYGDIYSFRVFGRLYIHLASIKAIKEAHITKGDCFAGRFTDYNMLSILFQEGVAFINGEKWRVLRKYFLQKFKEYGMLGVKENSSNAIQDALKETVEELHNSEGRPIEISELATNKCLSIICPILFGDEGIAAEEKKELVDLYTVIVHGLKTNVLLLTGNVVKYFIFPFMPQTWKIKRNQSHINAILKDIVKRHKERDTSHIVSIVDSFLKEKEDRRRKGDPTAEYFTDKSLADSLSQFVTDGAFAAGSFLGVFLLRLVEFPEEQQKVYEEIIDVVGLERLPTIEDKNKLPYTNAFIYEVIRLSEFFPYFPSVECSKETEIQGHKIPQGATTLINVYAAHRDPNVYDDPETFNPSRYLSSNKTRAELPILFGIGKRSCIGEAFTMIQTFLFLTTIVKIFRLEVPESEKGASITLWNPEVKICAIPRSLK